MSALAEATFLVRDMVNTPAEDMGPAELAAAADLLGITQPRVSDLVRGRLDKFSLEKLLDFLLALDRDVEIVVRKKPRS